MLVVQRVYCEHLIVAARFLFCQAPVFIPRSAAADLDSPKEDETVKVLGHEESLLGGVELRSCTVSKLSNLLSLSEAEADEAEAVALWAVGGEASRDCSPFQAEEEAAEARASGYRQVVDCCDTR